MNVIQSDRDNDGRIRWVICASDPGVHNWLDGSGSPVGTIVIRWQELPPGVDLKGSLKAEVVKLTDLPDYLPSGTRFLDAKVRAEQRAERRRQYMRRAQ